MSESDNQAAGAGYVTMRDLPANARPREMLRDFGARALSDRDLVAILLRSGRRGENVLALSDKVLARFPDLRSLAGANLDEICEISGIGEAKGCQILAAMELGRRSSDFAHNYRKTIHEAEDAYEIVRSSVEWLDYEELHVLLLSTKNEVMADVAVYKGTVNSASVRVAEVLRPAIRSNSPRFIVVHNHPSGDPTPSPEDIMVTRSMRQSAEMMGIEMLDHIIVGDGRNGRADGRFVSMKRRGLGF